MLNTAHAAARIAARKAHNMTAVQWDAKLRADVADARRWEQTCIARCLQTVIAKQDEGAAYRTLAQATQQRETAEAALARGY